MKKAQSYIVLLLVMCGIIQSFRLTTSYRQNSETFRASSVVTKTGTKAPAGRGANSWRDLSDKLSEKSCQRRRKTTNSSLLHLSTVESIDKPGAGGGDSTFVGQTLSFFQKLRAPFVIHTSMPSGWRTHAKLVVQPQSKWAGIKFGLYRAAVQTLDSSTPNSDAHHSRINEAMAELQRCVQEIGVKAYCGQMLGKTAHGDLKHVQLSVQRATKLVQLTLVWNAANIKEAGQSLLRLNKALKVRPDLWHSVTVNFQPSDTSTPFNYHTSAWSTIYGPPAMKEKVGNASFYFSPPVFRQVSLHFTGAIIG
jgi:hypothetical protein